MSVCCLRANDVREASIVSDITNHTLNLRIWDQMRNPLLPPRRSDLSAQLELRLAPRRVHQLQPNISFECHFLPS